MESNNFPIDIVKRTIANLLNYRGKFEVTNLLNCTLGLIILPYEMGIGDSSTGLIWDQEVNNIPKLPSFQLCKFEPIKDIKNGIVKYPKTLKIFLKKIRNGLAHQNIIPVNKDGELNGVKINNYFNFSQAIIPAPIN